VDKNCTPSQTPGIINLPPGTEIKKQEPTSEIRTSYGKLEECTPEKLSSYDVDAAKRLRSGKEVSETPAPKKTRKDNEDLMDVKEEITELAQQDNHDLFPGYKEHLEKAAAEVPKKVQFKKPEVSTPEAKEKVPRKTYLEKTLSKEFPEAEERVVQRMVLEGKMELSYGEIFAISNGVSEAFKKKISRRKVPIEGGPPEKVTNAGGVDSDDDEEEETEAPRRSHYACPLGHIKVGINGKEVQLLLDNGSMVNVLPKDLAVHLGLIVTEKKMNLKGIGGHKNEILGIAESVRVKIGNISQKVHFWVSTGDV
jgi:hypothetical protein